MHSHGIVDSYAQETRFRRLLRPHLDRLYRFAHRLTGSATDADDLLQDALVKVFARLDDLAAIEKPGPWLCRVMYNHFIDERRMYYRRQVCEILPMSEHFMKSSTHPLYSISVGVLLLALFGIGLAGMGVVRLRRCKPKSS